MSTTPPVPARASTPPVSSGPSSNWRGLLKASLPRTVGYGLFAMFALDLLKLAADYFELYSAAALPLMLQQANSRLAAELIERAGVPLVAYALVFMDTRTIPSRASRAARKALSWLALFAIPTYLILAAVSAYSGHRLISGLRQQRNDTAAAIDIVAARLPTLTAQQVLLELNQLAPESRARLTRLTPEQARAELAKVLPRARADAVTQFDTARDRAVRGQLFYSLKYTLGGALLALIMLLIAEGTRAARTEPIFSDGGHAPNLRLEDAVARGVGKSVRAIEGFGDLILPDFNGFRWYRRLKRWIRREK